VGVTVDVKVIVGVLVEVGVRVWVAVAVAVTVAVGVPVGVGVGVIVTVGVGVAVRVAVSGFTTPGSGAGWLTQSCARSVSRYTGLRSKEYPSPTPGTGGSNAQFDPSQDKASITSSAAPSSRISSPLLPRYTLPVDQAAYLTRLGTAGSLSTNS
jgi:hypothetical protein